MLNRFCVKSAYGIPNGFNIVRKKHPCRHVQYPSKSGHVQEGYHLPDILIPHHGFTINIHSVLIQLCIYLLNRISPLMDDEFQVTLEQVHICTISIKVSRYDIPLKCKGVPRLLTWVRSRCVGTALTMHPCRCTALALHMAKIQLLWECKCP